MHLRNLITILFFFLIYQTAFALEERSIQVTTPSATQVISLDALYQQAGSPLQIYDPFIDETVTVRGIELRRFMQTFAEDYASATELRLIANDNYTVTLHNWQEGSWFLVTHEHGQPVRLRNHGPIKLVETDISHRNKDNLRDFNDWVWMLKKIEVIE